MVYLRWQSGSNGAGCSGTLIGRNLVLTARHCMFNEAPGGGEGTQRDASDFEVYDGDEVQINTPLQKGTGTMRTGKKIHLPQASDWNGTNSIPEIAILETDGFFSADPHEVASGTALPDELSVDNGSWDGEQVVISGFSQNGNGNRYRLVGLNEITQPISNGGNGAPVGSAFRTGPTGTPTQTACEGDSGGPAFHDGKLVGVYSWGAGDPCGSPDYWAFLQPVEDMLGRIDPDHDGIGSELDNCPNVANADQANCDKNDEGDASGGWDPVKGDACDPDPCIYLSGISTLRGGNSDVYWEDEAVRVHYRGVGYDTGQTTMKKKADFFYCGCHDMLSPDPKDPTMYDPTTCKRDHCKDDDLLHAHEDTDTGWHRGMWSAYDDNATAPFFSNPSGCTPVDLDNLNPPVLNDCDEPVKDRLYRKVYADAPSLGKKVGDNKCYWTTSSNTHLRTRSLNWDWQIHDYPHKTTYTYEPPTWHARVRLWLRPKGYQPVKPGVAPNENNYSDVFELERVGKPTFFAALTPLESETSILPDPPWATGAFLPFPPTPAIGPYLLRTLAPSRTDPALEDFLWTAGLPSSPASAGLIVARLDPKTGGFNAVRKSRMLSGGPIATVGFAAARAPGTGELYVFSGKRADASLPQQMWKGSSAVVNGETIFQWQELTPAAMPSGRTGAVLAPDSEGQLVLMLGRTEGGSSSDAYTYDIDANSWTSATLTVPGLGARDSAGYSSDSGTLYLYGGRDGSTPLDGLYKIHLGPLAGERIDDPGTGPGARWGAALAVDAEARTIYLYGGHDGSEAKNDVWRYEIRRKSWTLISAHGATGAPAASAQGALAVSPVDGSVCTISGPVSGGASQPLWQLRGGVWKTYLQLQDPAQW